MLLVIIFSFILVFCPLQLDGCKLSVLLTFSYVRKGEQFFLNVNII